MDTKPPVCVYCEKSDAEIPLVALKYQGESYWICPEHLPILIHKPSQLAGKLPGAENLGAAHGH